MSDNFHFDVTGVPLSKALEIAFSQHKKAIGWAELPAEPADRGPEAVWGASKGKKRLVLFWVEHEKMTKLPAPMGAEEVESFVKAWLDAADYGSQPDHDGDNGKGFRVYNEAWGHIAGTYHGFVAIEPVWLMYGK